MKANPTTGYVTLPCRVKSERRSVGPHGACPRDQGLVRRLGWVGHRTWCLPLKCCALVMWGVVNLWSDSGTCCEALRESSLEQLWLQGPQGESFLRGTPTTSGVHIWTVKGCHTNEVTCIQVNKPQSGLRHPGTTLPDNGMIWPQDSDTTPGVSWSIYRRMLINGILKIKSLDQRKNLTPSLFLLLINNAFVNRNGERLVCIPIEWYLCLRD